VLAILGSGLVIVGALVFALEAGGPRFFGVPLATGAAALGGLWAFFAAWPQRSY